MRNRNVYYSDCTYMYYSTSRCDKTLNAQKPMVDTHHNIYPRSILSYFKGLYLNHG